MKKILMASVALIALASTPALAQQSIKIGFISTFSGPVAAIGNRVPCMSATGLPAILALARTRQ